MTTMAEFSAKDVMALRQKTGMPMMECKKALTRCNGDMAAAEEWLRENATTKMEARTERTAGEGRIGIANKDSDAVIVEVRTETDFTARNEDFVNMVGDITLMALKAPAGPIEVTDEMQARIDDVRTVTRENVHFARGERLHGGSFGQYVHHDGKRAALVQIDGSADETTLKGLCQHIVFHDPAGISEDDVPAEKVQEIRKEALAEAKEAGKNDEIAGKIADGKVRRYLEDNTLLHQKYVLDESTTIKEMLPAGVTIKRFIRYTLGA